MPDPTTVEAEPMPGADQKPGEIVERTSHHVEVMPLITDAEITRTWRVASALAKAGIFKDVRQAETAFAKILIGRDLGLSPTQSMQGLHVFDGNVQIAGPTLGAFIKRRRDEGYGYRVLERSNERARILFITPDGTDQDVSEYTVEDAQRAGLTGKKNWKNDPRSMLFWRAMSNGVKAFCPEVMGGIPVYVEGEIDLAPQSAGVGADGQADIPHGLLRMLERVWSVDRAAFRRVEVAARLDGTEETFLAVLDEVSTWLQEHEAAERAAARNVPERDAPDAPADDAEVVDATADADDQPTTDPFAEMVALQDRYDSDDAWRAQLNVLLSSREDLAASIEDEPTDEAVAELSRVESDLAALGIPDDWLPAVEPSDPED